MLKRVNNCTVCCQGAVSVPTSLNRFDWSRRSRIVEGMEFRNVSSLEALESRIAPAGVLVLTQTGHDLVISGDSSGANVHADVQQLPHGDWVFQSPTGT